MREPQMECGALLHSSRVGGAVIRTSAAAGNLPGGAVDDRRHDGIELAFRRKSLTTGRARFRFDGAQGFGLGFRNPHDAHGQAADGG
jgi:hypothetical protein